MNERNCPATVSNSRITFRELYVTIFLLRDVNDPIISLERKKYVSKKHINKYTYVIVYSVLYLHTV